MEKGKRGVADSLFGRGAAAPRLRDQQADRAALGRNSALPRGLALPAALSSGTAGLDTRTMGGKKRPAAPSLLSSDAPGAQGSCFATSKLARIRRWSQPRHGARKCLNGNPKSCAVSPRCTLPRPVKRKLPKNWRNTLKIVSR